MALVCKKSGNIFFLYVKMKGMQREDGDRDGPFKWNIHLSLYLQKFHVAKLFGILSFEARFLPLNLYSEI